MPATNAAVAAVQAVEDVPQGEGAPAKGTKKRVRKSPEARRAEIVTVARGVFAENGYSDAGLADVASAAHVSKGLLYHYFPDGRPQLVESVIEDLLTEFSHELRQAAKVPFSPRTRLNHVLGAIFGFFDENPTAYRLLFRDPWVTRDETIEAAALTARAQIVSELASLMASSGLPPDDLVAASAGILGFTLSNVEMCMAGQLDAEVGWRVTCDYCTTNLTD